MDNVRSFACLVIFVVACDHRPAPKQDKGLVAVGADAGAATAPVGDDACLGIGVKIAEIIISATTDATQKAQYEQERTKLVKRFSENCTNEKWPDSTRRCFMAATTPAELEVCSRELAKVQPATPPPSALPATGSAGSGVR
jgi:hypothetical protein